MDGNENSSHEIETSNNDIDEDLPRDLEEDIPRIVLDIVSDAKKVDKDISNILVDVSKEKHILDDTSDIDCDEIVDDAVEITG